MDLMLDTNIVLDHIGRREPFYELSRRTCLLGIVGEARTFVSASMVTDLFYLLRKDFGSRDRWRQRKWRRRCPPRRRGHRASWPRAPRPATPR